MPICKPCLHAAERGHQWLACSVCGRDATLYNYATGARRSVVKHKKPGAKAGDFDYWCTGSKKPPMYATDHDACEGCPCQHRPRGSWNQRPEDKQ